MEKSIRLNDGQTMPMVGFGTYQIPRRLTQQCVEQALEVGYRHIDTAPHYRAAYPSTVELAYNKERFFEEENRYIDKSTEIIKHRGRRIVEKLKIVTQTI